MNKYLIIALALTIPAVLGGCDKAEKGQENKMSIFSKLFGKKKYSEDPSKDPNMIRIYDEYGRELYIHRDEWRKNVLPGNLKSNWDNPDVLYDIILQSINDGFATDILDAAQHLFEIDTNKERAYCALAVVQIENGNLGRAEDLLNEYINEYGQTGFILTNLSRVYSESGRKELADETLLQSLRLDPNQENPLLIYALSMKEKNDEEAYLKALEEVASFEGSWRPQLWIAREYLEAKKTAEALAIYRKVLKSKDYTPDALMMITGDLGNNGYVGEIIEILSPIYSPEKHGIEAGFNLLQAYLQTENYRDGMLLIDSMHKIGRMDIQNNLKEYASEFNKIREKNEYSKAHIPDQPRIGMASIIRPIWLYKLGNPTWLFPEKDDTSSKIGFLALANLGPHATSDIKLQNEDEAGRLTRAIPLLLSEHFYLHFTCQSDFIVPYMPETGGYVVTGKEWTDEHLEKLGNNLDNPYTKIITGTFQIDEGLQRIELIVYDIEKSSIISKQEFKAKRGEWPRVYANILRYLEKEIVTNERVKEISPPSYYNIPTEPESFEIYLSALSQSLALTMANAGAMKPDGLFGERNMLDYFLNMCVDYPNVELGALFFISGILKNREYGSDIYREYTEKARRVVKDTDERELEVKTLLPILNLVYGKQFSNVDTKRFVAEIGDRYTEWLLRIEKNEL